MIEEGKIKGQANTFHFPKLCEENLIIPNDYLEVTKIFSVEQPTA